MSDPFVDTDVLIRFLTGDDPRKQAQSTKLLEAVEAGELVVEAPVTVVADAVYVLSSKRLYNKSHAEVQALLTPIVRLPGFKIASRRAVIRALELYGTTNLDFGDALIVAQMEQRGSQVVYSYDEDFDRIPGVTRQEPGNDR
jgi:predicted nucleic acid-binding protein